MKRIMHNEDIKSVVLTIVKLCLAGGIINYLVSNSEVDIFLKFIESSFGFD